MQCGPCDLHATNEKSTISSAPATTSGIFALPLRPTDGCPVASGLDGFVPFPEAE
jgi:hypothetical protein